MATEFRLPELGENVVSGQVVKVLVSPGETMQPGQSLLELETDKAVIEVPASDGGLVKEILVEEGQEVKVGQAILTFEAATGATAKAEPELAPEEAQTVIQPKGETSPTPVERAASETEAAKEAEPAVQGGDGKGKIEAPAKGMRAATPMREEETPRRLAPAAPSVRRFARELGVDIDYIPGSGPAGRISIDDVKKYVQEINLKTVRPAPISTEAAPFPLPDFGKWGEVQREPMSSIRRTTARRLSQAWSSIPHVTHFEKADITELEQLRHRYAKHAEAAGGKLTVTAILLKIVASALKVFPKFNASLDMANQEIIYKKYIHIGVAVDTEHGLLVPCIRDVDQKNIIQLSVELTRISEKARNRKVALEDLEGSTFTVTNLGGIGGTHFAPIINPPDVAILGVARASTEPVFRDGKFEPRLMVPLSLSYDHRLIDGADAARFMRWVVEAIEQPFLLSLEG